MLCVAFALLPMGKCEPICRTKCELECSMKMRSDVLNDIPLAK